MSNKIDDDFLPVVGDDATTVLPVSPTKLDAIVPLAANPQVVSAASELCKGVLEIYKIREQADAAVGVIRAQTEQVQVQFDAMVNLAREHGIHLRNVSEIMNVILSNIPDGDYTSRLKLMERLPEMIDALLKRRMSE